MRSSARRFAHALLVPALIFAALASMTLLVWRLQEEHAAALRRRHAEDVATQATRRLQVFFEAQLRLARLFGRRWAGHENRDFSERRFREFAALMYAEVDGLERLMLYDPAGHAGWQDSRDGQAVLSGALASEVRREVDATPQPLLLPPKVISGEGPALTVVLRLHREHEPLGYLTAVFSTPTLIDACFEHRIRSEFNFLVRDGPTVLFDSRPTGEIAASVDASGMTRVDFAVHNRHWQMLIEPRADPAAAVGWARRLPVVFGLLLSLGLAYLVFLLARQMDLHQQAHATALRAAEERQRAQQAQQASEARYRDVFALVTDGLLLVSDRGVIVDANPAAGRMHGCEPRELVGQPVTELLTEATRSAFTELRRALTDETGSRGEAIAVRRDGQTFAVELRAVRLLPGGVAEALVIVTDVSERQLAMSRLSALSRKVLAAQEEERARLSRDLHDELGQMLTALRLEIDWLSQRHDTGSAEIAFDNLIGLVRTATDELRRLCRGLRPPLLDDLGLEPALRLLVDEFRERSGIAVGVELAIAEGAVPVETALSAYRIVQEALTNVARHAAAKNVQVEARLEGNELRAAVTDDGRGFAVAKIAGAGVGLAGMRERASLVGGDVVIDSRPEGGTAVRFRLPVAEQRSG